MRPTAPEEKVGEVRGKWPYEYTVVLLNWFIFGFVALDRFLVANLYPWVLPELQLDYTQAGLIMSVLAVAWAISAVVFGSVSDRVGRRRVIIPSVIVFSLLSWATGLARSFVQLLPIRTVMGVAEGAYHPAALATVAEESTPSRRATNIGIFESAFNLVGFVIAPIYATGVASVLGWRWACYLTVIPGLLLALLFWRYVREPASTAQRIRSRQAEAGGAAAAGERVSWFSVFKHRNISVGCVAYIFLCGASFLWAVFGMVFLTNARHLPPTTAGLLMSLYGVGATLGSVVMSGIADRIGRKPVIIVDALLFAAAWLGVYWAESVSATAVAVFAAGFFGIGLYPLLNGTLPYESVPPALVGAAVGIMAFIGEMVGAAVIPAVGGVLADLYGLPLLLIVAAVCSLIIAVLSLWLIETAPRVLARRSAANK